MPQRHTAEQQGNANVVIVDHSLSLCFIGKYPPIEGGVSSSNYWLARGLAARGHQVHIVTNADEVEPMYRMHLQADDWAMYEPTFPDTGGRVRVFNLEACAHRTMSHIPLNNPAVSKLAGVATGVVRAHDCDAIFAYYYEPYAVAASLVAQWTGRPLIVKHAGSDLDRLFRVPDLATTYREVLRSADVVVTQQPLMDRFTAMGVPGESLRSAARFGVPRQFFHTERRALDVEALRITNFAGVRDLVQVGAPTFDPSVFTIGIYGKIGPAKGTYDLIAALGELEHKGVSFNFLAMIGETQAAQLIPTVVNRGFFHRCYFLPFLPSWKVPKFIRTCDAVCFLERDFPVAIHGPVVPREVLACGTCLVLSGEIVDKQLDGNEFITGKNFVRVDDPRDTEELEDRLHQLIQNRSAAVNIGSRGSQIPKAGEGYREFVESWESIFGEAARRREHPVERLAPSGSVDQTQIDPLLLYAPIFRSVLVDHASALINEFAMDIRPSSPLRAGIELCSFLSDRLSGTTGPNDLAKLRDALKYQRARIQSVLDAADDSPPFVVVDQLRDNLITADTVDHLRPVGGNSAQVVELDFDITPLFTLSSVTEPVNLRDLKRDPMFVLFQHTANSQQKELKINSATYKLFTRCDGTLTTGELVRALSAELGSDSADVRMGIYGALATLHREGVIVFGERMPGWGWTGGARWT